MVGLGREPAQQEARRGAQAGVVGAGGGLIAAAVRVRHAPMGARAIGCRVPFAP